MRKYLGYILLMLWGLCGGLQEASATNKITVDYVNSDGSIDTVKFRSRLTDLVRVSKENYDSLLFMSRIILCEADELNFDMGKYAANLQISFAHLKLGNNDSALYYAHIAEKIARIKNSQNWLAHAHKRIGTCYKAMADYEKAVYHFIELEKIARGLGDDNLLIDALTNKGITYRAIKDYASALRNFKAISEECPNSMNNFNLFLVDINIGHVFYDQGSYNHALFNFKKAKEYALKIGDSIQIALADQNLGNTFQKMNNLPLAEQHINTALNFYRKTGDKSTMEMLLRTLGVIHLKNGNYSEAEQFFFKSEEIARQMNDKRKVLDNYRNLAKFYNSWREYDPLNVNLFQRENRFLRLSLELQDSLSGIENVEKALELERKYESEKKNNQIAVLEKETEVQKSRQLILYTGMGVLVLLMGVLGVAFQYVRRTNSTLLSKNYQIQAQKNQIENQNKQLERSVNTQNKLFSIIAHDLRSPLASISNISVLLKMSFEKGDCERSESLVGKLEQRNSQVLQLTDNLLNWASTQTGSIKFYPEKCSLKQLLHEVIVLFEENAKQKNIHIVSQWTEDLLVYVDLLSVKTVFRNLMNNAIKFSFSNKEIAVSFFKQENFAIIKFSDQGMGIPEANKGLLFEITNKKQQLGTLGEKSSGLGLIICKEFIEQNGGRIWFESKENIGTDFFVSLPLFDQHDQILQDSCLMSLSV